ncbi:NUDIX hydrolase [candidate division WOR-3 bacterium]|nr:NUDIX hydrolase [candidate division WOR-3 bacterium]
MEVRVRSAVVIVEDGKVLLVKSKKSKTELWIPPGGGLEPQDVSETGKDELSALSECAKREAYEEAGIKVRIKRLLGLKEFKTGDSFTLEAFFLGELDKTSGDKDKIDFEKGLSKRKCKWFSIKDMQKVNFCPSDLILIAVYKC